jgi:cation transport ATPase
MPGKQVAVRSALQAARAAHQQRQQQQLQQDQQQQCKLGQLLLNALAWVPFGMWHVVTFMLMVLFGFVGIVFGMILGQPIYLYQSCTNCFAAYCYGVLQIMWGLAMASFCGAVTHREWVANRMDMPVAVFAAAVGVASLLFTTVKFCYDVLKDHKINLCSIACLNASVTLIGEGLWVVFDLILTFITDGFFCCVIGMLGYLWQVAMGDRQGGRAIASASSVRGHLDVTC